MGGTYGEIRGKSKIETYLKYEELTSGFYEDWSHWPNPKNKKGCKKQMVEDPDTGEWVLQYHMHT